MGGGWNSSSVGNYAALYTYIYIYSFLVTKCFVACSYIKGKALCAVCGYLFLGVEYIMAVLA